MEYHGVTCWFGEGQSLYRLICGMNLALYTGHTVILSWDVHGVIQSLGAPIKLQIVGYFACRYPRRKSLGYQPAITHSHSANDSEQHAWKAGRTEALLGKYGVSPRALFFRGPDFQKNVPGTLEIPKHVYVLINPLWSLTPAPGPPSASLNPKP